MTPTPPPQQPHLATWWQCLKHQPPPPIVPATWNRCCPHCHALLLLTEKDNFCCGNGSRLLPALRPLPARLRGLLNSAQNAQHLMEFSRVINNLFSFAGIGVAGGFQHFQGAGPPAVAITGQTYHLIRNTKYADHLIHWFLYDKHQREFKAEQFGVHANIVQALSQDLCDVNPYVDHLQHFHQSSQHRHRMLELKDFSLNGDFAAVMHASNSTDINPCSVVIRRHGHHEPEFINILS